MLEARQRLAHVEKSGEKEACIRRPAEDGAKRRSSADEIEIVRVRSGKVADRAAISEPRTEWAQPGRASRVLVGYDVGMDVPGFAESVGPLGERGRAADEGVTSVES